MEQAEGLPMATGAEETFAFARVLSRLSEMSSKQYSELTKGHEAPPEFG
jgi:protein AFG1